MNSKRSHSQRVSATPFIAVGATGNATLVDSTSGSSADRRATSRRRFEKTTHDEEDWVQGPRGRQPYRYNAEHIQELFRSAETTMIGNHWSKSAPKVRFMSTSQPPSSAPVSHRVPKAITHHANIENDQHRRVSPYPAASE